MENQNNDSLEKFITASMDFDKYAYFHSKAKNYSIVFLPRIEEVLSTGERRVARCDDDSHPHYKKGEQMAGYRVEFHNFMHRVEINPEDAKLKSFNTNLIAFLREKCEDEKLAPLNRQQLKEIEKPIRRIPENEVEAMLAEKDAEIARLKEMAGEKVDAPAGEEKKDTNQEDSTPATTESQPENTQDKDANVPF